MSSQDLEACRFHITVNKADIIYLNAVLDSYEGIGIMRTEDENTGRIMIYTSAKQEITLHELFNSLISEGLQLSVHKIDYIDELL